MEWKLYQLQVPVGYIRVLRFITLYPATFISRDIAIWNRWTNFLNTLYFYLFMCLFLFVLFTNILYLPLFVYLCLFIELPLWMDFYVEMCRLLWLVATHYRVFWLVRWPGIHPTIISESFQRAALKAVGILESMSVPVLLSDRESLLKSATTSLNSKVQPCGERV